MRIFISTGEVSGDLQGSLLVQALFRQAQAQNLPLEIVALGGDRMEKAGAKLLANTLAISSMGYVEALPFILPTLKLQKKAKKYLQEQQADVVVWIDYVGPNVAFGKHLRKVSPQTPTVYYIAPQLWVWQESPNTTKNVLAISDLILAIFPEESRFYQNQGAPTQWIGHPFVDRLASAPDRLEARKILGLDPQTPVITLLPASRVQELKTLLPLMAAAAQKLQADFPQLHFLVPLSQETYRPQIQTTLENAGLNFTVISSHKLAAIAAADVAIAKSGTVNLETALLKVPQVVIYRVSPITMAIARHLLKFEIPFMSPVNLMLMKMVVPELFQELATVENIYHEARDLLINGDRRAQIAQDYDVLIGELGETGVCDRAAQEILALAQRGRSPKENQELSP